MAPTALQDPKSTMVLKEWEAEVKRSQALKKQAQEVGVAPQAGVDRSAFYLSKKVALLESIKAKHDQIAQLEDEIRTQKVQMQRIRDVDEGEKYNAKPSWETTGYSVIPYRDPHPTGLSKRTPTGGFFSG